MLLAIQRDIYSFQKKQSVGHLKVKYFKDGV